MADEYTNIPADVLRTFSTEVFEQVGLPRSDAETVADTLVEADLRGVDSHGVTRVASYVRRIQNGTVNPRPNITVLQETPTTALLHGDNGMGQVVSKQAMDICIQGAKDKGIACVGAWGEAARAAG